MADFCLLELVLPQGPGPVLYRIVQLCQGQSKLEQFICTASSIFYLLKMHLHFHELVELVHQQLPW